jgi:hypothetical protein
MVIIMSSSRNLYLSILYHQSSSGWPLVAQAGAPGSIFYLGLGVAYVVADLQIGSWVWLSSRTRTGMSARPEKEKSKTSPFMN